MRMKYAIILHEETENLAQAEEALSKGVLNLSHWNRRQESADLPLDYVM